MQSTMKANFSLCSPNTMEMTRLNVFTGSLAVVRPPVIFGILGIVLTSPCLSLIEIPVRLIAGKELFIKRDGSYSFTYDTADEVVLGDTEPTVEGVLGTTFYYKGFSLGAYFRYALGGQIFNTSLFEKVENISTADVYQNQDKRALYDRWSPDNREAYFKGISLVQKTDKSSRFVMDENYIEGESFSVGYEFTQKFVKKLGLAALTVQAYMNDMFRLSTVKNERGIDYPFARTVSLSVSATF